jgi:peptidoglycan hydrolase-like protein with peptidoglycan-binding domain
MAVLNSNNLTLLDWAKRRDPNGKIPTIAELLGQTNEVLDDAVFVEGNLPTGHRVVVRTGLPQVYWRALNQGVPTSKSTTAQVDEGVGMLESRAEVDRDLATLNGDAAAFRASEDLAFIEAMNQEQARVMFYGNPGTAPEQYLGLAPRYGSLGAGNGANIMDAGGTGSNNASIWLLCWSDQTVFCTFPKGSSAGLHYEDRGQQTVYNVNGVQGTRMEALVSLYQWKNGLVVKDWRYAARICNVNVADVIAQTNAQTLTAATNIIRLMARVLYRIPNPRMGRLAFYMNRTIHSALSVMAMDRSQNVLTIQEGVSQFGTNRSFLSFLGVPIRQVDSLLNTEARVV